ncbi:MAG: hypothetical protein AVDCRST_MAG45-2548, partial [uncultured Solirubrobacterales bacterium]
GQADHAGAARGPRCAGVQPASGGPALSQDETDV